MALRIAAVALIAFAIGCARSDPPKETAPPSGSAKPTVRIAISAAAASAMRAPPDAGK